MSKSKPVMRKTANFKRDVISRYAIIKNIGVVPSKRTFYTLRLKTLIYIGSINQYPKRVYVIFFGNLILVCVLVRKLSYIHHKFNSYGDYFINVRYWLSLSV